MQCPRCLAQIAKDVASVPLALPCPSCGYSNEPGEKYCGGCGLALTRRRPTPDSTARVPHAYTPSYLADKILTLKSALEGERKQVTVLFADLKDSTELIRGIDPEAAQRLLDPALQRMMDAVHRFEGTVNQVLGDGIMALFGAPIAHEDHALRACYAALAMQTAMRAYTEEVRRAHGLEMRIRVGLNSGEVVVRAIGNDLHMDYSAVGETTHLAARMEQLATPGSIRLTVATLRLVEGLVQVNALGPVPVKGLAEPVEVFELLGASGTQRRVQAAAARGLTRFVGRQTEMATLTDALVRAGAGHGQVVALVGEAGVGKSRLVYELTHSHHMRGWLVLESASVSYGKATPYFPVIDLLKRYAHVEEHDDPRTIRAKVTGQVLTLDEALQDTIPALLSLLEALPDDSPFLQLDPSQRRQRTLTALKRVLLRESQVQPLLLVFEDLHWIDSETQALLDSLVESLPAARLLLLVNYRPEYQHGWGGKTYYTQVRLDPLPLASAAELLQVLLGNDPGLVLLKQLLIARTEGNPFFWRRACGRSWKREYSAGNGALIGSIPLSRACRCQRRCRRCWRRALTGCRLRRNASCRRRRCLAKKSLYPCYRPLPSCPRRRCTAAWRTCKRRSFCMKPACSPSWNTPSSMPSRTRWHTAASCKSDGGCCTGVLSRILEGLAPERVAEQVERLAHHALRGEVWDKAVTYCQQAGARAYDRAAFREAVASFEQALQALAHLSDHGDTRVLALEVRLAMDGPLSALGEHGRRLALLGEAEGLARALDDRARLGWVLARMTKVLWQMGDHDSAMAAGQQALELAVELGDSALQVQASHSWGWHTVPSATSTGQPSCYRRNVEAADRESGTSSTDLRLRSRAWLARTLSDLGSFAEGRRHGEEALRLATMEGRGARHRSWSTAASASCTSPKETWSTPSGCSTRAWPSVVPPATGPGCERSWRAWAMPMRSRGASRRGARCWRRRSAKVSARARCAVMPTGRMAQRGLSSGGTAAMRPGSTRARRSTWPGSTKSVPTRRWRCTSLASSRPTPILPMLRRPKPSTSRP